MALVKKDSTPYITIAPKNHYYCTDGRHLTYPALRTGGYCCNYYHGGNADCFNCASRRPCCPKDHPSQLMCAGLTHLSHTADCTLGCEYAGPRRHVCPYGVSRCPGCVCWLASSNGHYCVHPGWSTADWSRANCARCHVRVTYG